MRAPGYRTRPFYCIMCVPLPALASSIAGVRRIVARSACPGERGSGPGAWQQSHTHPCCREARWVLCLHRLTYHTLIIVISIFLELLTSTLKEWPARWGLAAQEQQDAQRHKWSDAGRGKRHA